MASALVVALLSVLAAAVGGVIGLRAKDRLHLALGLSAGVLLGLVLFDLVPEVLELSDDTVGEVPAVMVMLAVGFLFLHVVERGLGVHHAHEDEYGAHQHAPVVGALSAAVIAAHAFIDGLSIGVAFAVDDRLGLAVGAAVIAHRFADGLSTVAVLRIRGSSQRLAVVMLVVSTLAPVAGVLVAQLVDVGEESLALLLAFFAGYLLYLATSDVLPEAHSRHPSRLTLLATVLGMVGMGLVVTYG
jgi:ZIP family zinc transporter